MNVRRKTAWLISTASAFSLAGFLNANAVDVTVRGTSMGPARITITEGYAVVRETYEATLTSTFTHVWIPDIPSHTDVSSLSLVDKSGGTKLLSWSVPEPDVPSGLRPVVSGRSVRFDMENYAAPVATNVQLHIQSSSAGRRQFDLVYVMTGLSWRATYDVLLRGDLKNIASPMSIDVDGWVEIFNTSSRTFTQAWITIIGADSEGIPRPAKLPGILDLDEDSPLADLWRHQSEVKKAANLYPLKTPVMLPANETVMVSLVSVSRKPVDRILLLRSEEIPTDARGGGGVNPDQIIQFQNAADYGGGRSVPPGNALIHVGSLRSSLHQNAWFKHTPAQGDIRIDMGKFPGITAWRVDRGRVARVGGGYEHRFELRINNHLEQEVTILLTEQPPIGLTWSILRSNQKYDLIDRRLIFRPVAPAKSEVVIQYTLSVTIPES